MCLYVSYFGFRYSNLPCLRPSLCFIPEFILLFERKVREFLAAFPAKLFHGSETAVEFVVGFPQRRLKVDIHTPRDIGQGEYYVPEFFAPLFCIFLSL